MLEGFLKVTNVEGWAGLWMRIDDENGTVLEFDNMAEQPVRATTSWQPYSLELNVPPEASELHFGALLAGSGQVFVDDLEITTRGRALKVKNLKRRIRSLPTEAQNMGFEN